MSWLEPVQAGQAPAGSAASVSSTMARISGAWNGAVDEVEVEGQSQLVGSVAVELRQGVHRHRGLPDQQAGLVVAVGLATPAPDDLVHLGTVRVVDAALSEHLRLEVVLLGRRWVVPQLRVLDDDVAHVNAEAGNAPIRPEAEDAVEGVAHLLVPPVEIGLLLQVVVEVVLAGPLVEGPARSPEAAHPVVGRLPLALAVGPDVPVPVGRCPRGSRVDEPRMLLARVVRHDVHEHTDASRPSPRHQPVKVLQGPELGRDGTEVRDVITPVGVGGHRDRREPDAVHAQPLEVIEMLDDPLDVADTIGVAVSERAGVDLVQDPRFPPRFVGPRRALRHASVPTTAGAASRQGERSSIG